MMVSRSVGMRFMMVVGVALLCGGCATRSPVFYPNNHYEAVGSASAVNDASQCLLEAEGFDTGRSDGKQVAERTASGAIIGAASGAASGAVHGDAGRYAGARAAGRATNSALSGLFSVQRPGPTTRRFVERCLRERGYSVIGWE